MEKKLTVNVIVGKIDSHGNSTLNQASTVYSQIRFLKADGNTIIAKNIEVHPNVGRLMDVGVSGKFIIARMFPFGSKTLFCIRTENDEAHDLTINGGQWFLIYLFLFGFVLVGIPLSFLLIGIPIVLGSLIFMLLIPMKYSKIKKVAMQEGFNIKAEETV